MNLNLDEQLSRSFKLREFLVSETAARRGLQIIPTAEQIANLRRLCLTVLQPLRDEVRQPIIITSGLRPQWLNELVGGSRNSAHIDGRAADFGIVGYSHATTARAVKRLNLPVDQCILEFDSWVHVGIAAQNVQPRREYLTARTVTGLTVYEHGIAA